LRLRHRDPGAEPQPLADGVAWLGVRLRLRPDPWTGRARAGYVVPDNKVRDMLARIAEMTTPPSSRIDAAAFDLGRWIVSVNDQLRDWYQAYVFAENAGEVFRAVDEHSRERVGELLHSVTGTRHRQLREQYRVWLPRGFWTWQVKGCRLTQLSSLAPRCPRGLTRRPPWQVPLGADAEVRPAAGSRPPAKPGVYPEPPPPEPPPAGSSQAITPQE
jgi:hypothetical protein